MDHEAEYNNRALVPEHPGIIAGWVRDAAAFRAGWAEAALDLPYGPGERERLDLFRPGPGENWPVALFVHGGYWQSLDRRVFSHCARGLLAHGVAVAVPSYDLARRCRWTALPSSCGRRPPSCTAAAAAGCWRWGIRPGAMPAPC
ncbi:alpha/beta hydrolase [Paeniroseomonas aquatica]|uniref:alpha/beta hydrolase n=1 Tax=Paeniroseomonas aquatica TaxID=373043 RepID=UPI00361B8782